VVICGTAHQAVAIFWACPAVRLVWPLAVS
jgi:hypothetical protein